MVFRHVLWTNIRGPLTTGEIALSKTKIAKHTPQTKHGQETDQAHGLLRPNDFCFARGLGATRVSFRLAPGPDTPRVALRLAWRTGAPWAVLRLAGGSPSAQSISTAPPNQSIKCPDTSRACGSNGESPPYRIRDNAQESSPGAVRALCGVADVITWHCATRSHPSSTPHPSKGDGNTLKERTAANLTLTEDGIMKRGEQIMSPASPLALCGQPRPCATSPGTVGSCSGGTPPCLPLCSPVSPVCKTLKPTCGQQSGVDTGRTTLEVTP
jgi:hypothetical protein